MNKSMPSNKPSGSSPILSPLIGTWAHSICNGVPTRAAERSLLQVIKYDAQSITAHRNLSVLYEKMGRMEHARLARARADQLQRSGAGH